MKQGHFRDELGEHRIQCSERISIYYEGTSEDLINHEIDAVAYSLSISGYAIFTKKIIESLFGNAVRIRITAHKEGSFLDICNISWETVGNISAMLGILSFFGIDAKFIQEKGAKGVKVLVAIQKKIVDLIIEAKGDTDAIITKINSSEELTQEDKNLVVSIINDGRNGLDTFTSPLDKAGYNKIEVSNDEQEKYQVVSSQRPFFRYVPKDIVEEQPYKATVSIIYLSPELSKWQFQGRSIFWADVCDENFLNQTKDKKFSELKGKKYVVTGTKRIVKNDGKIKGKPSYTINTVSEVEESMLISM